MKILLIDDDKDDQTLFCEAINQISKDIVCDVADNGLQGLALLNASNELPQAVFLDVNMPIMGGRETLRIIRATPKLKKLPVTIYSTSNDKVEMAWFREMKARYIVKPNNFDAMVNVLDDALTDRHPDKTPSSISNILKTFARLFHA